MKKITACALSAVAATSMMLGSTAFASDVNGHWAESYLQRFIDEGYMSGYTDGTYKPNNTIARSEMASLLNKMQSYTEKGDLSKYKDVVSGAWYYDHVANIVGANIMVGTSGSTWSPNGSVTREQVCVIVCKLQGLELDTESSVDALRAELKEMGFKDTDKISGWAMRYVHAAVKEGYLTGTNEKNLNAQKAITRAEAVTMLCKCLPAENQTVYVNMNIPYDQFYKLYSLKNDVDVDGVSSATTTKVGACENVYSNGTPTIEGGMDLDGVVYPVAMDKDTYEAVKGLVAEEGADYYISEVLTAEPTVYATLTYEDGKYSFSDVTGEETVKEGVAATITSVTAWGDYEIDITDQTLGLDPETVYGAYLTAEDGEQYAMLQSKNLWTPTTYSEFAWSTRETSTDPNGGIVYSKQYESMEGKNIASISYITNSGIVTYKLADSLYVAPHYTGEISAQMNGSSSVTISDLPEDLEDVTVSVGTSGRKKTYLVQDATIGADGVVNFTTPASVDTTYNVIVSSSNYAAITTTIQVEDAVYVNMNVPYESFYAGLKNDVGTDVVSSATTSKVGACENVYSNGTPTIEGGMDLDGVVVPVKMAADVYEAQAGTVTDANADYYMSEALNEDPAVYLTATYADGKYSFSGVQGKETVTEAVAATITSVTAWGDYEIDITDETLGLDPETVYGAYLTAEDGTQYAMLQSKNLWTPTSYFEFAWSTRETSTDPNGGIVYSKQYESMEGKSIASITYITTNGIVTYVLDENLYVAPHYTGDVTASMTADSVSIAGLPADLGNATVSVYTGGRKKVYLVQDAPLTDAVKLTEAPVDGTEYTVVVSNDTYAAITATVTYVYTEPEPTTYTGTLTGTATVLPDEDEDFDEYDITVTVTVEDDVITGLEISGADSLNAPYCTKALNGTAKYTGLVKQYVGKNIADAAGYSVDAVSGATCSSDAIEVGVQNALAQLG